MPNSLPLESEPLKRQNFEGEEGLSRGFPALQKIEELETLVDALVASWHSSQHVLQAREWHRVGFERPIIITPLDEATEQPDGESKLVSGYDISPDGISFTHVNPLPSRKVAVTLSPHGELRESIVVRLSWCRFMREGLYQSGGRFVRSVEFECEQTLDPGTLKLA